MDELREKLKAKYGYENICVVHASDINPLLQEGFNPFDKGLLNHMIQKSFFMRRYKAEFNPAYRQLIPYNVLRHGDKLFATRRLAGSGESRLVNNISIGIGGHVNNVDCLFGNMISNNVMREMHEELNVYCNIKPNAKYVGFLNDNSNEVSRDHLAIIVLTDVSKPNVSVRETEKLIGEWVEMSWLREHYDELESWSQKVFDVLYERMKG